MVTGGWWLEAIEDDHVLLSDGDRLAKVQLYLGSPTMVSDRDPAPAEGRPGAPRIQSAASHPELSDGQARGFNAPPAPTIDEPPEDSPMAQWRALQQELNDPGMSRRFYPRNLPDIEEAWENEGIEILRNADTPLEPGQSRRFGAVPPADTENPEE